MLPAAPSTAQVPRLRTHTRSRERSIRALVYYGWRTCSLLRGFVVALLGNDVWVLGLVAVVLGLGDLDEVGHDLVLAVGHADLGALHDLDLKTKHTLAELNATDGNIDEIVLGLTSGDLITLSVLLGLGTLATHLTGDHDLATDGATSAHHSAEDVVGGHTHGGTGQELELEGLNVSSGAKVAIVGDGLDGKVDLVVAVVEVVSLLDQRLDLLDLTGLLGDEVLSLGGAHADLSVDGGGADLNASVALHTESLLEELVQLSLEHTVGNELLLGVDLLNLSFGHRDYLLDCF